MLISRKEYLAERVVFVDGLPGCGKTLFSPIVAAMDRVELLSYAYEIEHYCALQFLDKLPMNSAQAQISMMTDLQLYDNMMGRRVNFRPSDLSSAIQDYNPSRYFQRLFQAGDSNTVDVIRKEKPILNLTTHQLLAHSEPIWNALGDRCVFVEIVRHPLYMVRQQLLNVKNLYDAVNFFTVRFLHNEREIPYFAKGWEDEFINSSGSDAVINCIYHLTKRTEKAKDMLKKKYSAKIITVPFESFVLDPEEWVEQIAQALGSSVTLHTRSAMERQNVPRDRVAQGIDIPVYRRCGWVPPVADRSEYDELVARKKEILLDCTEEAKIKLNYICEQYENNYWKPL
jgi:hypothetical protein